ncbi:hypothetical protein NIIDMKKI_34420 [Mycobacterium kansasii]|uniref:Uncharacterized protein n=1 Tax=Mycobacterium kansasii TaxID=1768 RepID=A0A7G1IB13_MYCKA|nr:hypothetical protein NIIDMKKI_34420 [Mycobacterium kansasii]
MRNAEQIPGGFRMRPPVGVDIVDGPACLTFHTHGPAFESQENASLTGHCRNTGEHIEFDVERALNDFIIPAKPAARGAPDVGESATEAAAGFRGTPTRAARSPIRRTRLH